MKQQTKNIITVVAVVGGVIGLIALIGSQGGSATADPATAKQGNVSQGAASAGDLVGKPAPQFALPDINGKVYAAESLKGKNVVLFFNEGLMCYPACWSQIAKFGSDPRFNSADTVALSIVMDRQSEWQQAIGKMPELANATTLFDDGGDISRAFNVLKMPSSMHYGALPGHTYVLIDKNGIVREVYDDPRMAIRNDEIFAKIQTFNK